VKYAVQVQDARDLSRQVVKSEAAVFEIPALDFQQPPSHRGGQVLILPSLIEIMLVSMNRGHHCGGTDAECCTRPGDVPRRTQG
jgi:C4-type Zn-finger protein